MKSILLIITTLLLFSCKKDISNDRISVMSDNLVNQAFENGQYKYWNPSGSDIRIVESLVLKSLKEKRQAPQVDSIINTLSDYYFQLVPYLNSDGEKIVLVEALCSEFILGEESSENNDGIPNWTTDFYTIQSGGGKCFWELKVNINYGYYYDFEINTLRVSN